MTVDFDALLAPVISEDVFGTNVLYTPAVSAPGAPGFAISGSFERHHVVTLDEIARSELKAAGNSTTAPVLTVRLSDFPAPPRQEDRIDIKGEAFLVYDIQPDGEGFADLVLRELVP